METKSGQSRVTIPAQIQERIANRALLMAKEFCALAPDRLTDSELVRVQLLEAYRKEAIIICELFVQNPAFGRLVAYCDPEKLLSCLVQAVGFPARLVPTWDEAVNHPFDKVPNLCIDILQLAYDAQYLFLPEGKALLLPQELQIVESFPGIAIDFVGILLRLRVVLDGRRTKGSGSKPGDDVQEGSEVGNKAASPLIVPRRLGKQEVCALVAYVRTATGRPHWDDLAELLNPFVTDSVDGDAIRKLCE